MVVVIATFPCHAVLPSIETHVITFAFQPRHEVVHLSVETHVHAVSTPSLECLSQFVGKTNVRAIHHTWLVVWEELPVHPRVTERE